ncbi:MAG: hypothetical protein KJ000_35675 [Pirellulaceae bacterium]|nr:hypothetical protein [Pirellulaceae bacterium]
MQNALHIKTTVLPGQRIEITAPHLNEGDAVDVFLVLPSQSPRGSRAALEIIRGLHGHRLFETADDVDRYLQEERDTWDR